MSVNSMGMEGRSLIGHALRARCYQKSMPPLSLIDIETLLAEGLSPELQAKTNLEEMARALLQQFREEANLSLRQVMRCLPELASFYPFDSEGDKPNL